MRYVLVLVALAACLAPRETVCSDGQLCAAGKQCFALGDGVRCILPDQATACAGKLGGDACDAELVPAGLCNGAAAGAACTDCACLPAACGDGFVSGAEDCDGARLGALPSCTDHAFYDPGMVGCAADCTYDLATCARRCGDGTLDTDVGELCDGAPPLETCVGFGYDAGFAECRPGGCSPDFSTCHVIGWRPVLETDTVFTAAIGVGDDVFVAGNLPDATGIVEWRTPHGWTELSTGIAMFPTSISATGPNNIYVIGASSTVSGFVLAHYDGAAWSSVILTAGQYVWQSTPGDVFVFSAQLLQRGDGHTFTPTVLPGMNASDQIASVWGSSASDVYAVISTKFTHTVIHFDGATWTALPIPGIATPRVVSGSAANAVFVGGAEGLASWNGATWTMLHAGPISDVVGRAPDDLYVVANTPSEILHFDGARWSHVWPLFGILALTTDAAFAVETGGRVRQYGGAAWRTTTDLGGVATASSIAVLGNDVFVASTTGLHAFIGDAPVATTARTAVGLVGTEVYAADSAALDKWTGVAWTSVAAGPGVAARAIAGNAQDVFVAVSPSGIARYDGTWHAADLTALSFTALWCDGGSAYCFAAGKAGLRSAFAIWDGATWSQANVNPPSNELNTLWGVSRTELYTVGGTGDLGHYDGTTWTWTKLPGTTEQLTAISGTSATDQFVGTQSGALWHFDGTRWTPVRNPALAVGYDALAVTAKFVIGVDGGPNPRRLEWLERTTPW